MEAEVLDEPGRGKLGIRATGVAQVLPTNLPSQDLDCEALYLAANCAARRLHGLVTLIFVPRPEKAFQPVTPPARDDVYMQMRHGLADAVVYGDKSPFGLKR
jgi:hypothetical protein